MFLLITYSVVGLVALGIYYDMVAPLVVHKTWIDDNSVTPGEAVVIKFEYSREAQPPAILAIDRKLFCDDGTLWNPGLARGETLSPIWMNGFRLIAELGIIIPKAVKPNQFCYYTSLVTYKSHVLQNRTIKNPPNNVKIQIK